MKRIIFACVASAVSIAAAVMYHGSMVNNEVRVTESVGYRISPDGLTLGFGLNAAQIFVYDEDAVADEDMCYSIKNDDGSVNKSISMKSAVKTTMKPYSGYEYEGVISVFSLPFNEFLKPGEYELSIPSGCISALDKEVSSTFSILEYGAYLRNFQNVMCIRLNGDAECAIVESSDSDIINFNGKDQKRIYKKKSPDVDLEFFRKEGQSADITVSFYNKEGKLLLTMQLTPTD